MEEVALQALRDGHLLLYCATSAMEPTVGMCKAKTAVEKIVADFLPKHIQPRYLSIFTSRWSGKGRSTPSKDAARWRFAFSRFRAELRDSSPRSLAASPSLKA
jgi:hypothetical protein